MTHKTEQKVPADLHKALAAAPSTMATWKDITPIARRDFISWIESAKQPETRKRRIESIGSRLASGKRRPCCYAIVPMNLYKAFASIPKARIAWKDLTPTEKRDFVSWIDGATDPKSHELRIEKTCAMLVAGKRCP